jgi:GT2 family glycosyltransferase
MKSASCAPAAALPLVSVIVPTFSRPGPLARCLAALAAQDYPSERCEVIVVDDGSEQPLDEILAGSGGPMPLTLLRQANAGPGAARNRGAAAARGTLLAFTDDDCLPEPGWLRALASAHQAGPCDLVGGRVLNHDTRNAYAETSQLILDGAYRYYPRNPGPGRFFASNNMAVPAAGFRELAGFDAGFRIASEDRDLCDRWLAAGYRLRHAPEAVVRHAPQLTLGRFARQYFNYGRGAYLYHRARRRRGGQGSATALDQHARFLVEVGRGLLQRRAADRLQIGALLLLWQAANLTGYLAAAVSAKRRGRTTASS